LIKACHSTLKSHMASVKLLHFTFFSNILFHQINGKLCPIWPWCLIFQHMVFLTILMKKITYLFVCLCHVSINDYRLYGSYLFIWPCCSFFQHMECCANSSALLIINSFLVSAMVTWRNIAIYQNDSVGLEWINYELF